MAGIVSTHLAGERELMETLSLIAFSSAEVFKKVVDESARNIRDDARRRAPRGRAAGGKRQIRREIRIRTPKFARQVARRSVPLAPGLKYAPFSWPDTPPYVRDIRSEAPHSWLLELGTGIFHTGKAGKIVGRRGPTGRRRSFAFGSQFIGATKVAFFPNVEKLATQMNVPLAEAWKIALAIFRQGGTRAQPFLFPAFEHERPNYLAALRRELGVDLRRFERLARAS